MPLYDQHARPSQNCILQDTPFPFFVCVKYNGWLSLCIHLASSVCLLKSLARSALQKLLMCAKNKCADDLMSAIITSLQVFHSKLQNVCISAISKTGVLFGVVQCFSISPFPPSKYPTILTHLLAAIFRIRDKRSGHRSDVCPFLCTDRTL